ncbi:MAG: peptidylprolyl isomerase [Eubacteriales bacterium]|nr:peptidylprolyl isomerase [Eubacteriales bacterium]
MDEKEKSFNQTENEEKEAPSIEEKAVDFEEEDSTLAEKDGVKYETNDNWQFDAEAPSLEDNIVLENEYFKIDVDNSSVKEKPVSRKKYENNAEEIVPSDVADAVKKPKNELLKFIPLALFVAAVIAVLTVLGIRYYTVPNGKEGDMMNPGSVVAEIDGTNVSIGMFNYYYSSIVSYYEQYANYGYFDLDTSTDYALQYTTDDEGNKITWEDFFKNECLKEIETTTAYYNAGIAAGVTLTKAQQETVDSQIESLKESASEAKVTLNQYIAANFGKYCTEETLRLMLEQYYITANYKGMLACDSNFSDEEINKYFEENKDDFKEISFSYLAFEYDTTDEDTEKDSIEKAKGYMKKMTDDKAVKALVPEVYADYIKNDAQTAMESDSSLSEKDALADATKTYEQNTVASITGSDSPFDEDITKWLFSDETEIGSTNYYIDEDSGYLYAVLKTEKPTLLDDNTYSVRHILIMPESDEDSEGTEEYTDEQWSAAEKEAKKILDEYNKGDKTEYSFALLAEEYSDDTASTSASSSGIFGGLYEGITEGEMVPEFEGWSLDSSRKYGDTGIVKSEHGYHIMYFVSSGPQYKSDIITELRNEKLDKISEESNVKVHDSIVENAIDIYEDSKVSASDSDSEAAADGSVSDN